MLISLFFLPANFPASPRSCIRNIFATSVHSHVPDVFALYAPGAGIAIQSDSYPGPEPITMRDHLY